MKKKKITIITIVVFVVGLIIAGSSYAFWSWSGNVNKNVIFNVASNLKNYIVYNEGESAFTGELNVSNSYQTNSIHSTISIYKTTNVNMLATIHMDVNQIGPNMKNSTALKWVVTAGTVSNVGAELAHGNFVGTNNGDTLTLVPDLAVNTTETFYTIWIWLDASQNPSSNLTGETLDTNVWVEVNQVEGAEDRYEITNTNAHYQQISATVVDSKAKVTQYAVTETNSTPSSWITITPATDQAKVYNLNETVNNTGTYYIWFKDENNRVTSKQVTVSEIDNSAPSCSWGAFTPVKIANGETSTVTLTCTDSESGISVHNLTTADFTTQNNRITLTNVTKESVTNGYRYTITVTGTNNDGTSYITLADNKVRNGVNLANTSTSSGNVTVENIISVSDAVVTLEYTSTTYNGNAKTPSVTVVKGGNTLTLNTDYTVAYTNNTNVGTATVTITGIGNYGGETTRNFTISYNSFNITLDNANATTNGTSTLYMRYADGVYLDSSYTNKMTTSANPITIPQRTGYDFLGYYDGTTQLIDSTGKITSALTTTKYSSAKTLNASWIDVTPPTGTVTTEYQNNTITATVTVTDDGSGIASLYGYKVSTNATCDENTTGFIDSTSNTYNFSINQSGIHYVCVRIEDNVGNYNYISAVSIASYIDYSYTGNYQTFTAPESGYYKIEAWGAKGVPAEAIVGGAYTSGYINLNANDSIYIYVGQNGSAEGQNTKAFNSGTASQYHGGGATDIRYFGSSTPSSADLEWDSSLGRNSRIMVAAGSGASSTTNAGAGGTLLGINGSGTTGGNQKSSTVFGISNGACSGGNGYYSGGSIDCSSGSGAGGSSFISGYAGVNAINASGTHINDTRHYSTKYFINNKMIAGNQSMPTTNGLGTMVGNKSSGFVKITFFEDAPVRINSDLNNVRYIKDCINGNSIDNENRWSEVQAIYNGVNLAKNKTVIGTTSELSTRPYSYITDGEFIGNITTNAIGQSQGSGTQCIMIDLGDLYNLDEIAVWHYSGDNRTYYDNVTYVSNDNVWWIPVINNQGGETLNGKRVTAWDEPLEDNIPQIDFYYTGDYQTFTIPESGYYKIETWGAQGGHAKYNTQYYGGKGAYASGYINLTQNENLYIYVGGMGVSHSGTTTDSPTPNGNGYNGGSAGIFYSDNSNAGGGGGATDIRLVSGSSDNDTSLNSRIMVAAGGGGATSHSSAPSYSGSGGDGGTLVGNVAQKANNTCYRFGDGGKQTIGGYSYGTGCSHGDDDTITGGFGNQLNSLHAGGGGGYYNGGSGQHSSAGGGSSFISGYAGVNAITSVSDRTHTNNTLHYSNKYFINNTMTAGVNSGNGRARITYLGNAPPTKNSRLNNVRYIKDCAAGNTIDGYTAWREIQAIKNGENIAKGKSIIDYTETYHQARAPYTSITDGLIPYNDWSLAATGDGALKCVTVDLGDVYDIDEVAVWHIGVDATEAGTQNAYYINNVTYVSSDNTNWSYIISTYEIESPIGKRFNKWQEWVDIITCQSGTYLPAEASSCATCLAGYACAGGTFTSSATSNQGITQCSAGQYSASGASSCTNCVAGSYSAAGATGCTVCPNGKTNTAGSSSCPTNCSNSSQVASWLTPTWNSSNNSVSNLCTINSCNYGYFKSGNNCTNTVVISFNANGGGGAPGNMTYTYDPSGNTYGYLPTKIPAWSGRQFMGWSESSSGSNPVYQRGVAWYYSNISRTLYAKWNNNNTCTVAYELNGGTNMPEPTIYTWDKSGSTYTNLTSTVPRKSGKTFKGWSESATATSPSYSSGQVWYCSNGSRTLYAVWG